VIDLDVCSGSIVFSKAGRDKGNYFIILSLDDNYAYICDGGIRKVTTPKKKKMKHLKSVEHIDDFISEKIKNGGKVTNREVRRSIYKYVHGTDPEEGSPQEE